MKKSLVICCFLMLFVSSPTIISAHEPITNAKNGIPYKYTPDEGSIEELYKDIIVTLLLPCIDDEIEKHYGKVQFDLFRLDFLEIERPRYRSFSFLIKVQVKPFIGAHNEIGIDELVIRVKPTEVKVEKYEHIKSFPPPPHLEKYYDKLKLDFD